LLNSISVRRCLSQPKSRSARWTAGKIMIRLLPSKASPLRTARVAGRQILAVPAAAVLGQLSDRLNFLCCAKKILLLRPRLGLRGRADMIKTLAR
jgi:hypothetical protein